MRDDPEDGISRFRATLRRIMDRKRSAPVPEPEELPPEEDRGFEFPASPNPLDTVAPAAPPRQRPPENKWGRAVKDAVLNDPLVGGMARAAGAGIDAVRERLPGKMGQRYDETMTGMEAGANTLPFTSLRAIAPVKSWRDNLDKITAETIAPYADEVDERGGDPGSNYFKGGMIAPMLAGAVATQGGAIAGLGAALRGGAAFGAARGIGGARAVKNVLDASRTAQMAAGAGISAGVTAATTGDEDEGLIFGKGKLNAVKEDLLFSGVGTGLELAHRTLGRLRNRPSPAAPAEAAPPAQRLLPARTGIEGVMPPLNNDPNGRTLITPPPTEVSPNAHQALTDGEAMERINAFREQLAALTEGTTPPKRPNNIKARVKKGIKEEGARTALMAGTGAAMSQEDEIREQLGLEPAPDNAFMRNTGAGAVLTATMYAGGGAPRRAFKAFSRLEDAVENMQDVTNASDLLKRLPNLVNKKEMDARGITSLLETAKNQQRKVSKAELQEALARTPNPVEAPLATVRGEVPVELQHLSPHQFVDRDARAPGYASFVERGSRKLDDSNNTYRETLLRTPNTTDTRPFSRSQHFEDYDYGAHVREVDRITDKGDPVLHVVERQSDNFQRLRDHERRMKENPPEGQPGHVSAEADANIRARLGADQPMKDTWSMDTLKTAIDTAVRTGKKYITINKGDDILPVVSGGGKERLAYVEKEAAGLRDELTEMDGPERPLFEGKLKEHEEEISKFPKMQAGMERFYGSDQDALIAQWERQHGIKLPRTEVTLRGRQGVTEEELVASIAEAEKKLKRKRITDEQAAGVTSSIARYKAELADLQAGGRKAMAIEITPELKAMVEGKGQALNAMAPATGIVGAGIGADDERTDAERAAGGALLAGSMVAGSPRGRGAINAALHAIRGKNGKVVGNLPKLPDSTPPHIPPPSQRGAAGPGNEKPYGPTDTRDYLNFNARWKELENDPDGKLALQQRTQALTKERGADFRERVTQADVRAQANRLGLDAEGILKVAKAKGLSPAHQLAAADVVAQNMDNLVAWQKKLDDINTPADEKEAIQRALGPLEAQTNELLWASLTERTEAGRNLAFQKIAAQRTMDPAFWMSRAAKNLGHSGSLTAEHMGTIMQFTQAKDRVGLASFVASLKPGIKQRVLTTAYKAGLLTNPATYSANITSNAVMTASEIAKDAPATLADRALTGMLNAALGGDKVHRSRDFSRDLVRASWQGAKEGAGSMGRIMKGKDAPTPSELGKLDMQEEVRTGNALVDGYLNLPFRVLRASDKPFREAAFMRSLEQQRRLLKMPPAKTIADAMKSSTDDMITRAVADAEIATFQNESMLGNAGGNLKRGMAKSGPGGAIAAEVLLPFTKTPGAVASSVVRYSPLGLARGVGNVFELAIKGAKARKAGQAIGDMATAGASASEIRYSEQQLDEQIKLIQNLKNATVDRLGRGAVGAGIIALGAVMAQNGMLAIKPGRTDRAARDQGEVTGDPGATIDFGPLHGQIEKLSPVANLLLLGAYGVKGYEANNPDKEREALEAKATRTPAEEQRLRGYIQQEKEDGSRLFGSSWGTAIAATLGGLGNTIVEQPVFSGIKRVEDALNDPVKAAGKAANSMIGSVIPAGVAALARATDGTRRETETLGETLRSRTPGLSRTVPAKLDALGTEVRESFGVRLANLISPMRLSSDRTGGETTDAQVRKVLADLGVPLSRINERTKDGETHAQARTRQQIVGESIVNRIGAVLGTLEQLPVEQRADYVKMQVGRARELGNARANSKRKAMLFSDTSAVFDGRP